MQGTSRRKPITRSVAAGSIWETRMRIDEVKGGIKVFNGSADNDNANATANAGDEDGTKNYRRLRRNQSDGAGAATSIAEKRKRKSWKPPDVAPERSPIQLRKVRPDPCKEVKVSEAKSEKVEEEKVAESGSGKGEKMEVELEEMEDEDEDEEVKSFDDKEIVIPTDVAKKILIPIVNVDDEKRVNQICEIPFSEDVEKSHPVEIKIHHQMKNRIPINPIPVELDEEVFETVSVAKNQMNNIVDLVMWRDISRSTLVFGFGTFILMSSSYTKDINFSLISAISYLGLVYLALIFLYKSILQRGAMNMEFDEMNERDLVGEEEAIWLLRMVLPYINEMLLKLRALFCGDPAVTMKLAVLLFVMARCGSSINIWTLSKLVFFGIFTIPKICSSYRDQMTRYGNFWVERFRDGWESCTHKKAVAAAVFTVIWNVSSTLARVWAVFMLVVAWKLYQQRRVEDWSEEAEDMEEEEVVVVPQQKQEYTKAAAVLPVRQKPRFEPGVTKVYRRELKMKKVI